MTWVKSNIEPNEHVDLLPDTRTRVLRGSTRSPLGNLIPIHCANCGKPWGMVPEKMITFAFALCDPCAETHGDIAHTYLEPDAVFWARCAEAQKNEGIESPEELKLALEDSAHPLSKLAAEWRNVLNKIA